ncbi:MAG: HD domain-containing phosphohydrolase, partial [Candidatus Dormibacteria bacterium]
SAPTGHGLLGDVSRATVPVRLRLAADHPLATPLPPGHPPVTSFLGVPIPHLGERRGAFYLVGKEGAVEFTAEDEELGETVAAHVSAVVYLYRQIQDANDTHESLLTMLVEISDAHEHATEEHSHRVSAYARQIAAAMAVSETDLGTVSHGALLHDVGKLGVPESIIQKPGALTDDERVIMMAHSQIGAELVSGVKALASLSPAIRHHHERWDGGGYPDGLTGEAIPLEARIVAVADTLDAMTTDRPYRAARTLAEALEELRRCAGTHFDPTVVAAAIELFGQTSQAAVPPSAAPARASATAATLAERHSTVQTAAWRLYARLGQELRSVTDLPLLASRILELLESELGLSGAELSVLDPSGQILEVVAARGTPVPIDVGERRERGRGLMWAALEAEQTLYVADAEADPRYVGTPGSGHVAMVLLPLVSSRGPQGVLVAYRAMPSAFDRLALRQLEAVAVPIAETLTVARLLVRSEVLV